MNYFPDKEFLGFPATPSLLQQYLRENIRRNLNTVRTSLATPIVITSCYRDKAAYRALVDKGYNPSPTSDHFWADPVECHPIEQVRYGKQFIFSVGAVDVKTPGLPISTTFRSIVAMQRAGLVDFGQIIFERSERSEWVHLSNPRTLVFRAELLKLVGAIKNPVLTSLDGGATYTPYTEAA